MLRTIKAVIDKQGRVSLKEKINLEKPRKVLVTILEEEITTENESTVGSIEVVDDLENGSQEITRLFNDSLSQNNLIS